MVYEKLIESMNACLKELNIVWTEAAKEQEAEEEKLEQLKKNKWNHIIEKDKSLCLLISQIQENCSIIADWLKIKNKIFFE
jgi:hypothetical protein